MNTIKNTQGIDRIVMYPVAYTRCEIGGDWYKNELEIELFVGDFYPDYMQMEEYIMQEIDGKTLNIEDVVERIYNKIMVEFSPQALVITNRIRGCKTHFAVDVIKHN